MSFLTNGTLGEFLNEQGRFWYDLSPSTSCIFSVRACSHVEVILAKFSRVERYHAMQMTIGDDTNSACFKRFAALAGCVKSFPLKPYQRPSCTEERIYWVRWEQQDEGNTLKITSGYGNTLGEDTFLAYYVDLPDSDNFQINSISLDTSQFIAGYWGIHRYQGRNNLYHVLEKMRLLSNK